MADVEQAFTKDGAAQDRMHKSGWTVPNVHKLCNEFHYPLAAFIQGLWADERDSERALKANMAALVANALLRVRMVKRINDLGDLRSPVEKQELISEMVSREIAAKWLHRNFGTPDPCSISANLQHYLSSQLEHLLYYSPNQKTVRPILSPSLPILILDCGFAP